MNINKIEIFPNWKVQCSQNEPKTWTIYQFDGIVWYQVSGGYETKKQAEILATNWFGSEY